MQGDSGPKGRMGTEQTLSISNAEYREITTCKLRAGGSRVGVRKKERGPGKEGIMIIILPPRTCSVACSLNC